MSQAEYAALSDEEKAARKAQQNKDKLRRYRSKPESRAKINATKKAWVDKNRDRHKTTRNAYLVKWRAKNPESRLASTRKWREANREKEIASSAARRIAKYWEDPEKSRAKAREFQKIAYARDPHKFLLQGQRRRALKRGDADSVTSAEWSSVLEQFGHSCAYCLRHSVKLEIDHVEPLDRGGKHQLSNLVPACRGCNSSKGNRTMLHWLMRNSPLSPVARP